MPKALTLGNETFDLFKFLDVLKKDVLVGERYYLEDQVHVLKRDLHFDLAE